MDGTVTEKCYFSIKTDKRNGWVRIKLKLAVGLQEVLVYIRQKVKSCQEKDVDGKLLDGILRAYNYELQLSSTDYARNEGLKTR